LTDLPDDRLSFLLFPVEHPQFFDAVVMEVDRVREIQVKRVDAASNWIWGAFKMPGPIFAELQALWHARERADEYIGTLINAWIAQGGEAVGIMAGTDYVDIGTLNGYRSALSLLSAHDADADRSAPSLGWPAGRKLMTPNGALIA
jgi:glucose-1-phosphate thymidylyltransferase